MANHTEVAAGNPSETQCYYCLGDRPDVHGILSDMVVLYIAEKAGSFDEALREFEEFKKETHEAMRLNVIVKCQSARYFQPVH